jgi:hypothetical protein
MSKNYGSKKVLLLGMVYSEQELPNIGQEYRDRVRCMGLESHGYEVFTLDNKHSEKKNKNGKHCMCSFTDSRRMALSMKNQWGNISFDLIILDYFFSPVCLMYIIKFKKYKNKL